MRRRLIAIGLAALAVSGCETINGAPAPVFSSTDEIALFGSTVYTQAALAALWKEYSAQGTTEPRRKSIRNELALARMYAIDLKYRDFELDISAKLRGSDFLLDATNIVLGGVGALIEPVATKNIIHAVSAGLTGARSSFDEKVLMQQTETLIVQRMRADRAKVRTRLLTGMAKGTGDMPLPLLLSLVAEYYTAGTIPNALYSLQQEAGAQTKAAKEDAESAESLGFSIQPQTATAASLAIGRWIRSEPEKVAERQTALNTCVTQSDTQNTLAAPEAFLADAGSHPALEKKVIACLAASAGYKES